MSSEKNELSYDVRFKIKTAIAQLKELSKEAQKALDIKSDDSGIKKYTDSLTRAKGIVTELANEIEKKLYSKRTADSVRKQFLDTFDTDGNRKLGILSQLERIKEASNPEELEAFVKQAERIINMRVGSLAAPTRTGGAVQGAAELQQLSMSMVSALKDVQTNAFGINDSFANIISSEEQAADDMKKFGESAKAAGDSASEAFNQTKEQIDNVGTSAKDAADTAQEAFSGTKLDLNADTSQMSLLELISRYRQIKDEMKALEAVKDPTKEQGQRYHELNIALYDTTNAINNMKAAYKGITQETGEVTLANRSLANSFKLFSESFVSISQAQGLLGKVKAGISALGPAAMEAGLLSKEALTMATSGINLVIEVVARLATIIQTVLGALKTLASSIVNAFKNVLSTLKKVASELKDNIVKTAERAKKAFNGMFSFSGTDLKRTLQMLTKYIFGVRSFFFLYRKLRTAVSDGLKNLVQYESASNETNHAITELRTSLLYLKNAWAAAFAPIINVVYPILVRFMDLLASIGNAIARFVGALTGQSTVLQALKVDAGDYADSLDKAGGSAGKAAKEQDKLNDRLAAFDDLNVLGKDQDTDPNTGSGGGGGADDSIPSIDDMFERVRVKMDSFMMELRKAWETGDGFDLGQIIAKRLGESLDNAHEWLTGEGREKILKIANLIGTTFDGILSDGELAGKIGQVLADVFGLAMDFINTVITPERMYMVGVRIAEALNTAIPQIVPKIGETLGNLLRSAISNAWGFISTADFASWGQALGDAINNFFKEMGTAKGILGGIEFTHTGWQLFGMTVTEFAQKILDFFINVINEVDWNQIGEAIGDFLGGIDTDAINKGLDKLWTTIKNALSSMWDSFSEANPKAQTTLQPFANVFTTIVEILPSLISKLEELAGKLLDLITPHLQSFIENLPETLTLVFNAIVKIADILESVFGVVDTGIDYIEEATSDATSFLDLMGSISGMTFGAIGGPVALGAEIGENARIGLGGSSRSTSDDLAQLMFGVSMDEMAQSLGKNSSAITANLKDIQEHLKGVGETADRVKGDFNFDSIATNIKGMVSESTNSLGEIPTKFTDIKSSADAQSTGIKDKFVSTFADIKNQSIEGAKAVQDNFLLASDNIKDSFINAWGEIKKSISEGGDMFVALSDGMGNTVKSLLNAMINGINISITKPLQDISKSFNVLRTLDVNGSRPFAGIPYLNVPTIPHLAQGAVIPPNKQFMAVLGDQTSGTNIEAPLDTIRQAVGDELTPYLQQLIEINAQVITAINNKNLTIGDRQIGQANARYTARQGLVRGTSM